MRPAVLALLCLGSVAACGPLEPNSPVEPLFASWMEWQAEVQEGKPVEVLIVGLMGCGSQYVRRYEVDEANSTIVFNPYEIVPEQPCVNIAPSMFTDKISLLGLKPGTYKLRSGEQVFGEVKVIAEPPTAPPLNGAGRAEVMRDPDNCLRLRPAMSFIVRPMLLENPPDTTSGWLSRFVTGHIIEVAAPVCGNARVFHLLTRESPVNLSSSFHAAPIRPAPASCCGTGRTWRFRS